MAKFKRRRFAELLYGGRLYKEKKEKKKKKPKATPRTQSHAAEAIVGPRAPMLPSDLQRFTKVDVEEAVKKKKRRTVLTGKK